MPPQKIHPPSWWETTCWKTASRSTQSHPKPSRSTQRCNTEIDLSVSRQLTGLFLLTPSAQLQNVMDKVCPLSFHTYLSCNQIFSIWRESKCCNCFPKTEKRTLRNFSNMWFHFNTSWLGSQLGWIGKRLKITHNSLTQWFSFTRGLTLAMGIPCCPSLKQHAYSTGKAPKVEVHPCAFIPGSCPSPGFNNKVIALGGEKKKARYHGVLLRSPPCHAY